MLMHQIESLFLALLLQPLYVTLNPIVKRTQDSCMTRNLCPLIWLVEEFTADLLVMENKYLQTNFPDKRTKGVLRNPGEEQIPQLTEYLLDSAHWLLETESEECDTVVNSFKNTLIKLSLMRHHMSHVIMMSGECPNFQTSNCKIVQKLRHTQSLLIRIIQSVEELVLSLGGDVLSLEELEVEAALMPSIEGQMEDTFQQRVRTFLVLRDMRVFHQRLLCGLVQLIPEGWDRCGNPLLSALCH